MKKYIIGFLSMSVLTGLPTFVAQAAPEVALVNNSQSADAIAVGQSATFTATFGGNETGQRVILDLELFDSTGHQVAQSFSEKVTIPAHKTVTATLVSPATLPAGTYYFSVGVFNPQWQGLVHWYDHVRSLTVGSTTQHIFIVRIDRPTTNLPNGATATIAPTLINDGPTITGATVTVSLWRGGNFIDDETFTNQTLTQNVEKTFSFTTIPLMQGSYTIKTLVRDSSGTILQNFPDLGSVFVNP